MIKQLLRKWLADQSPKTTIIPHTEVITPQQRLDIAAWAQSDTTRLVIGLLAAARPLPSIPTTGDADYIGSRAVAAVAYSQGYERALLCLAGLATPETEQKPLSEDWTNE